ncbi:hypothetical protein AXFE_09910 [Acidithrix ferrooxidans]|uniref:Uncharacterized protein n=1 Tax=Acidithrix ferrooxidans TaxID=1280514 RepID=A0A0D8HJD8_9ACTN|nr:hypothetical protein AXFE_09910 [Acidithrix ferrooxidans]
MARRKAIWIEITTIILFEAFFVSSQKLIFLVNLNFS